LQLPLFVISAPLVVLVFSPIVSERAASVGAIVLAVTALPYLFINPAHPVLLLPSALQDVFFNTVAEKVSIFDNRMDQYFGGDESPNEPSYLEAASFVDTTGCTQIGLITSSHSFEYPLWVLLQGKAAPVRIEHVSASDPLFQVIGPPTDPAFAPCVVLLLDIPQPPDSLTIGGGRYARAHDFGLISAFVSSP
jgi:hypothetical protein